MADHILEMPGLAEFCGYCFKIKNVKVGFRQNLINKFKYRGRLSNRFPTVIFRGIPCTIKLKQKSNCINKQIS